MWILVLYFLSGSPLEIKWFPSEESCQESSIDVMQDDIYDHKDHPVRYECKLVRDWRKYR